MKIECWFCPICNIMMLLDEAKKGKKACGTATTPHRDNCPLANQKETK